MTVSGSRRFGKLGQFLAQFNTVSSELFRQHDSILGQPFFIRQATWHLALRRTMLAECAADPALRYAEGLPQMINA
jgi:hypothetical protein